MKALTHDISPKWHIAAKYFDFWGTQTFTTSKKDLLWLMWWEKKFDLLSFWRRDKGAWIHFASRLLLQETFEKTSIQFRELWSRSCLVINWPKLLIKKNDLLGVWLLQSLCGQRTLSCAVCRRLWVSSAFSRGWSNPSGAQLFCQRVWCWCRGVGRAARLFCSQLQGNNCDFHTRNL